jgi:hypothetical protein
MQIPTDFELQHLMAGYDPAKAHDYYEKHKHLTGRQRGSKPADSSARSRSSPLGLVKVQQKHDLKAHIQTLELKLHNLEQLIQKKEAVLKRDQATAKSKAKKERAAKDKNKPQTAAEKAKAARDSKQYRRKHSQELKTKAKQDSHTSGGGSGKAKNKVSEKPIAELKALATRVKGQLAIAKQKLAAL